MDVLDRRDEAMAVLVAMPARWKGSGVLVQAAEFHAAKLLEGGKVDQAVAAVEALGSDHPAQAMELGRWMLAEMAHRPAADDPSGPGVQGRLRLAEYCYRHCDPSAQADKVTFGLVYAEALLGTGRADQALELLSACRAAAEAQATRQREEIGEELSEQQAAVEAAGDDLDTLRELADELMDELAAAGLKPADSRDGWAVQGILAALDGAASQDPQRLAEQLASALHEGFGQVAAARKQAVPARGDILSALARAYADLGRNEEAAELYGTLAEGLDPHQDAAAYWQAELGYCRAILALPPRQSSRRCGAWPSASPNCTSAIRPWGAWRGSSRGSNRRPACRTGRPPRRRPAQWAVGRRTLTGRAGDVILPSLSDRRHSQAD